jgi:ankyrin repeat protein
MKRFEYKPIDLQGRSFRLVQLFKAEFGPVQCGLFDAQLDDEEGVMEYEALSYTWGDTYKPHEIEIDGKMMPVTKNLSLALRSLRYPHQDRLLWIDAICIDQNNDKERGHQVLQMASIYKRAEQVVIWLGPATTETDFVFQHMLQFEKETVKRVCKDWKASDERWRVIWQSVQSQRDNDQAKRMSQQQQREGLTDLLTRSWFSRVWIVQEVANARAAKITCGTKSVSARTFALLPFLVGVTPSSQRQAILDVMPGPTRNFSWWTQNQDLFTLLLKFRESDASDPRDKIYALLGISSDRFTTDFLQPDYERSVAEVIQDTVAFLLRFHDGIVGTPCLPDWTLAEFLQNLEPLGNEVCLWAAGIGSETIVKWLLDTGRADSFFQSKNGQTSVQLAAKNGHEAIVKLLIDTGGAINLQNKDGQTPLQLAAENGHEAIVRLLLDTRSVVINLRNKDGKTPLFLAAENGHEAVVKQLLYTGIADDMLGDSRGWIPLWVAATNGYETTVEMLLEYCLLRADESKFAHEADPEANKVLARKLLETNKINGSFKVTQHEQTPLWWAIQNGHTALVELFLKTGRVDINAVGENGEGLLQWTALNGYETTFRLLLNEVKVDLVDNAKDQWAWGILTSASKKKNDTVVKLLLDTGRADVFFKDARGRDLMSFAASRGHKAVVKLLLDSKWSDDQGRGEALWVAANHGHESIVKLLLDTGEVDVNFRLRNEQTPLWRAAWGGKTTIVKLLLSKHNIEIDPKDDVFQQTPLSMAAECGHVDIVKLLLETNSVEVYSRDRTRRTPLDHAAQRGHKLVVKLLEMYISSR